MDFAASVALATILFSSPLTSDILRDFCGADTAHVTSPLLAHDRRASQDCHGGVTYGEDLVEMSGSITGSQHRFCPQWSFLLVCISLVTSTQGNHTRPTRVSSSEIFPDLFHLQDVPWMGLLGSDTPGGRYPQCPS